MSDTHTYIDVAIVPPDIKVPKKTSKFVVMNSDDFNTVKEMLNRSEKYLQSRIKMGVDKSGEVVLLVRVKVVRER